MGQEKGAITVFLTIIILIIMVLACVLVDGARIRVGETQTKRAVENAIQSALAGYNAPLKKNFGIFALNDNNPNNLKEQIKEYMNAALKPQIESQKKTGIIDLYDYQVEDVKVTPIYNLTENEVVRKQILEYMKYRAPKLALEKFWEKAKGAADSGKAAEISQLKMQVDKLYIDIIKDQNSLIEIVKQINGFNYNTAEARAKTNPESVLTYLEKYNDLNKNSLTITKRLLETIKEINEKIFTLKDLINSKTRTDSSGYLKELYNEVKEGSSNNKLSIKEIEKNLPSENYIKTAIKAIKNNRDIIREYNLEKLGVLRGYNNKISLGKKISWIEKPNLAGKDTRNSTQKDARMLFKTEKEKTNPLKQKQKELPSYVKKGRYPNKLLSQDFASEDAKYKEQFEVVPLHKLEAGIRNIETNADIAASLGEEIEFKSNNFFTKAFDFIKSMSSSINEYTSAGLENCRDELYLDEYVIGTFNNAVPVLKDGTDSTLDLSGNVKNKTVNNEVEYILCGNTSDAYNLNFVKGEILLTRFATDTINIYRDPKKVESALAIAMASSSWWSFGTATPIVHNLILCGWGMTDAVNDINQLMKGESIPLFKKFEKVKPGAGINNEAAFSYHDYLRIFLLIENPEKKMNRIEDLIQIKSGKKLSGFNTYLRVEATISMKYLFMTQAFMPKRFKTPDGSRHEFKVIVYQGY